MLTVAHIISHHMLFRRLITYSLVLCRVRLVDL